jgi:hypothetical protein
VLSRWYQKITGVVSTRLRYDFLKKGVRNSKENLVAKWFENFENFTFFQKNKYIFQFLIFKFQFKFRFQIFLILGHLFLKNHISVSVLTTPKKN